MTFNINYRLFQKLLKFMYNDDNQQETI